MNEQMTFEAHLGELFTRYAVLAPVEVDRSIAQRAIADGTRTSRAWMHTPMFTRRAYIWAALLLLLIAAAAAAVVANRLLTIREPVPGIFVTIGSPVTDRTNHVATKLADGRVLIAGGATTDKPAPDDLFLFNTRPFDNTPLLFDPVAASFTRTGRPLTVVFPLSGDGPAGAVAMPDGRVLLVTRSGGPPGARWSFQSYHPELGAFRGEGLPISVESGIRDVPRILRLSTGELIAVGPSPTPSAAAQIFRLTLPAALAPISSLAGCPEAVEAVVTPADLIAVLCPTSVWTFDPATGSPARLDVSIGDGPRGLVVLTDGRVLVANGLADPQLVLIDPVTGSATPAGAALPDTLSPPTRGMSMTLLGDGRVLMVGGTDAAIWDPATRTTRFIAGPLTARNLHTATLLDDGRVLVFGGTSQPSQAEIFDPTPGP